MTSKRTKKQAIKYLKSLEGKQIDYDGFAFYQCFDVSNQYYHYLFGHGLKGAGAKDIPTWNDFSGEATVYQNTPSFIAEPGDIFVYGSNWGNGWGHTGVVLSGNINNFTVLEQNFYGGGMVNNGPGWEKTTRRVHSYESMWFIRPKYKPEKTVKEKAKAVVSKVKPTKKKLDKKKIMLVAGHGYQDPGTIGNGTNERDFIRKNIVDNVAKYLRQAGHEVAIYGKSQDMYQDTSYGVRMGNKKDYGLYWVKSKKYDTVVEFHLDSASPSATGGHVIIPAGYPANSIDKGIQEALKSTVGVIRGVTERDDLLNCNVANEIGIDYRLVELGFITSSKDMNYIKKNLQSFTKRIAEAINGRPLGNVPAKNSKKNNEKTTWDWAGRFTANTTIKVRRKPNGEVVESGSWIYPNQWIDFDQLYKDTKNKLW